MAIIDNILEMIRYPQNGMRIKNVAVIDIAEKLGYLLLTGGEEQSVLKWLETYHKGQFKEVHKDKLEAYDRDIFAILDDPETRYWNGITEWSTCFEMYEWWQHDDIMEWFPHFDRYTWRYSEQIEGVHAVKHMFKLDRDIDLKMQDIIKQYDLKLKYEFNRHPPRYKQVEWVNKVHENITPKFKQIVNDSPELRRKLDEYLAPDQHYYDKAK